MNPTTVPGMQPFQYAYMADSGRVYLVKVAYIGRVGDHHDFQYSAAQVDSAGSFIGEPTVSTKSVHRDCIAARSKGYVDFWKAFATIPARDSGMEAVIVPPGLIVPGPTVVAGQNWYAGGRDPEKNTADPNILCPALGNRGDWYAELNTGGAWRKRMGDLEYMAMKMAESMEHSALGEDSLAALRIPQANTPGAGS